MEMSEVDLIYIMRVIYINSNLNIQNSLAAAETLNLKIFSLGAFLKLSQRFFESA